MTDFFRFPHTPHLAWLGAGQPRDDKVLSPEEARELLSGDVLVEEKVDGANLGLSVDEDGELRAQNRGTYIDLDAPHGQFKPLRRWLDPRRDPLADALFPDLMLFGEWCYAVHSVQYTRLPDWFLAFDVYDRGAGEFWSAARRDELVHSLGLALVPRLGAGRFDERGLTALLGHSQLCDGPAEGLYLRRDDGNRLVARAKLVRREFTQAIDEHWSRRALRTNTLASNAGGDKWH
ncbi:RNA ligase family protein [Nannocystis pusilla]|uniref:RNA ligase family protein n=1 Tax=Nannocystis pusilla TaxID=889268 RepID=A0ABS7TIR6_9BACT|nr:RNA ligase family protein [Nannocystis pusilla]